MKRMIKVGRGFLITILMFIAIGVFLLPACGWAACTIFGCPENSLPDDPGKFNGLWWGKPLESSRI